MHESACLVSSLSIGLSSPLEYFFLIRKCLAERNPASSVSLWSLMVFNLSLDFSRTIPQWFTVVSSFFSLSTCMWVRLHYSVSCHYLTEISRIRSLYSDSSLNVLSWSFIFFFGPWLQVLLFHLFRLLGSIHNWISVIEMKQQTFIFS